MSPADRACLNCGAALSGPFCAQCGQRSIPAYPTVKEMAGDAWEEMSGVDGRVARTMAALFAQPGTLTVETLRGRRAGYIKPLRLYLSASLLYFVIAAAAPNPGAAREVALPGEGRITINVMDASRTLTPEQREAALKKIQRAPAVLRPFFLTLVEDPQGLRSRVLAALPKMVFALVPIFALILALFYRGRRYMQHLIFALHTNAAMFLALIPGQLVNFTGNTAAASIAGAVAAIFVVWYAVRAQRVVYGEGLMRTLAKSAGLLVLYAVVAIPALVAVVAWAAYFR